MRKEGLESCLVWPEQGEEGLVTGADTGEVGLLVIREAKPRILPRPFFSGLCVSGGLATLSTVLTPG